MGQSIFLRCRIGGAAGPFFSTARWRLNRLWMKRGSSLSADQSTSVDGPGINLCFELQSWEYPSRGSRPAAASIAVCAEALGAVAGSPESESKRRSDPAIPYNRRHVHRRILNLLKVLTSKHRPGCCPHVLITKSSGGSGTGTG